MRLEPRVQLDVAGRSENFLVDTGGYLLCADLLLWSLLLTNLYHLGPDLDSAVASLSRPVPVQPPLLGRGVASLSCCP